MNNRVILLLVLALFIQTSCDLIDGTGVENPNLTLDAARELPNPSRAFVNGLQEQLASTANSCLTTQELATDNYVNVQSFFNQNVDAGIYRDIDTDFLNCQVSIGTLREQAEYVLSEVIPTDPVDELEAEAYFFKGIASLLAGEIFTVLPAEELGPAVSPSTHLETAVQDFSSALAIDPDNVGYMLARARAHYNLGNQSEAVADANSAITADAGGGYVRYVLFDAVNGPANTFQNAVHDRGNFDDLQPLPSLDFLDPKYFDISGSLDSDVPLLKIEEAHLILAEAKLADSNLPGALTDMTNLVNLVNSRTTVIIDDSGESRNGDGTVDQRPNNTSFTVRASDSDPFRSGLVIERTNNVEIPTISGTSLTPADIASISTATDALTTLYLLRQEVFFGEGRRMIDLGIRWPVAEQEALINPNIVASDRVAIIPDYLPPLSELDLYTLNGTEVTIQHNINRVIATGRGNKF
ncbi:hypothetical protein [Gracilimonas sp.]|uniref:hypothetical protein n=1 Tax=Gracilimonas sp. TaxID=1974203 RepID=UPI0032EF2556